MAVTEVCGTPTRPIPSLSIISQTAAEVATILAPVGVVVSLGFVALSVALLTGCFLPELASAITAELTLPVLPPVDFAVVLGDEFIALVHISGETKEDVKAAGDIKNITAVNRSASGKAETANDTIGEQKTVTAENNSSTGDNAVKEIYSPLKGEAVKLSKVPDDTFANEILGKGMAVIPGDGVVVSPVDGEVSTLFDTLHAIGVTGDNGLELLIHVGINTVELEGKYYKALVKEGDKVTKGQPLLKFDIEGIRSAGYNTVTPVIITNSDEYESVEQVAIGDVEKSALVMNVR